MGKEKKGETLASTIYVRLDEEQDGTTYLLAYEDEEAAVQDTGITEVGVYKLERIRKLHKVIEEV